jgi:hypothetical protein
VELERNVDKFKKLGLNVIGLSYDSPAVLKNFAERKGVHFTLLSDPDSKIIRQLGILNEEVPKDNFAYGVPYPGTYILDSKGGIVAKYFEEDYKQRYTAADILVQRYGVMPEGRKTEVEGKQLNAATTASSAIVAPGQRIALTLDLEMKPGMHVYAPGVGSSYIPIEWKMADSDLAKVHPVTYPNPEILFLPAINEKVPVLKDKVRLVREVTIGPDAKVKAAVDGNGQFTLEGTLAYQACDDRMCYFPQQMPLKWTLIYEAFDRARVPKELQRTTR